MTFEDLEEFILTKPGAKLTYPFGEEVAVYKVGDNIENGKMFALIPHNRTPLQVNLKCDPQLSDVLRNKYESVMPGYHMNKKHWNTILLTGQLDNQEIIDLINHSYQLVVESLPKEVQDRFSK